MAGIPQTLQTPPSVSVQTMLYNTYLQIIGGGTPFVGPLDALVAEGATLLYAGSVRRLLSSWTGNAMRLQGNGAGTPIAEIPFLANGDLDLTAVAAAAAAGGGSAAGGETWYDQSGNVDATQTVIGSQIPFGTAVEAKGGFGDATSVSARFLNLPLGTRTFPVFVAVALQYVSGVTRSLFNTSASATTGVTANAGAISQNFGVLLSGSASEMSDGTHILGALGNGALSKNFLDGTLLLTGDAGSTLTDWSLARIGNALSTSWFSTVGNSLSEIVIFDGDPTGLASWNAFVENQKSYFGVA